MERQFAIVITCLAERNRLPQLPWLEERYGIDEGDWIVLTHESWLALANGEADITADLERKLLVTFYLRQPDLIAVIGQPIGRDEDQENLAEQTRRILRRIHACLLPTDVLGFVVDACGEPLPCGIAATAETDDQHETNELALAYSAAEGVPRLYIPQQGGFHESL